MKFMIGLVATTALMMGLSLCWAEDVPQKTADTVAQQWQNQTLTVRFKSQTVNETSDCAFVKMEPEKDGWTRLIYSCQGKNLELRYRANNLSVYYGDWSYTEGGDLLKDLVNNKPVTVALLGNIEDKDESKWWAEMTLAIKP